MLTTPTIIVVLAVVVFLVAAISLAISAAKVTSQKTGKKKGGSLPGSGSDSRSPGSMNEAGANKVSGSFATASVPLLRWEGVREAAQTCHPGGGKFTISFVPPGVWAGGRVNGYTLTGSYDTEGNKIMTEAFGNSSERRYEALSCNGRTSYSGINCKDGIVIENGQPRIDATGENTCSNGADTAEDWIEEIHKSAQWLEECFFASLGIKVQFEVIGYERFVDDYLPEFGKHMVTREEMTRHNIGDFRICAYDFNKEGCELQGVLQYAYLATPNDFSLSRGYIAPGQELGFYGNVAINTQVCWRKSDVPDPNYYGGDGTGKCGWRHLELQNVLSHELCHSCGIGHLGTKPGDYPPVDDAPSIMEPTADFSQNHPSTCGTFVRHWLQQMYCGEEEGEGCDCNRQTAWYDADGQLELKYIKTKRTARQERAKKLGQTEAKPMAWMISSEGECRLSKAFKE